MIANLAVMHLLSGGLDSVTMLYDMKRQGCMIHCLLFDYKQRHAQELVWAKHHCKITDTLFTVLDLPPLGGLTEQSWIVPNRNAIFLSVAVNLAAQAGSDVVTIGCNADDATNFRDCSESFIKAMQSASDAAGYSIRICAPYSGMRKSQIVSLAKSLGVSASETWSCYRGGRKPCGECIACTTLTATRE